MEYSSRPPVVGGDCENQPQEDNMIHAITRSRRIVIAFAVAALLGGTALLLSLSAAPASATVHGCPQGEFCLYFNEDANGGFYHFAGSDPNLDNDRYKGGDNGETVGDTSRYVWNNGVPENKGDVIIYGLPGYRGARDCIFINSKGQLPHEWWNNIESYRWVTRTECIKAGPLPLFDD
jgi:hypothetical protein